MNIFEKIENWLTEDPDVDGIEQEDHDYRKNKSECSYSILVEKPGHFTDGQRLADKLKFGHVLIIDVSDLSDRDCQRLTDFLNGVVMARNGMITKISGTMFVCSPESVKIVMER
ncbi:MAG: cell division protein SepF [Erysipelotrichaceae bacterium]|nr:cell division protein SepF [Erysipelotrichaceae bacterium]